jgi:hypothetical protein
MGPCSSLGAAPLDVPPLDVPGTRLKPGTHSWLVGSRLATPTPHAATVATLADSRPGSLRDSLAAATLGGVLDFAVVGTITRSTDELLVDENMTIGGPGAALTIDGNGACGSSSSRPRSPHRRAVPAVASTLSEPAPGPPARAKTRVGPRSTTSPFAPRGGCDGHRCTLRRRAALRARPGSARTLSRSPGYG